MFTRTNNSLLSSKKGITLIEVTVAMFILTIVGFGTLTGLLQARKATEGSIYLGTATTIAQGYIEQMKNMDFVLLDEAVIPELMNQGAEDSLTVSPMTADLEAGNVSTDIPNSRSIDINNTPNDSGDDLKIDFYVYIDDLTDLAGGVGEARRIVLRYVYTDNSSRDKNGIGKEFSNTIYSIRSEIPTF